MASGTASPAKIVAPLSRFWVNPIVRADAENEA
jgi:hypothetical protein